MTSIRDQKHKILIYIVSVLFFLLCAIFYTQYLKPNNYTSKLLRVHSTLSAKERLADEYILKLSSIAKFDLKDTLFFNESTCRLYNKEGLIFLVYEDSTLRYWSDNSVVVSQPEAISENNFAFFSNAWFEIRKREVGNYLIVGLIKIKNEFVYENQYLKNAFQKEFNLSSNLLISEDKSENNIYTKEGDFLFSLIFPEELSLSDTQALIITALYLLTFILIIALVYQSYLLLSRHTSKWAILILGFILDILIIRFVLFYFKVPGILYTLPLFKPAIFASSGFLPSLGDLLLNAIALLSISYAIFKNVNPYKVLTNFGRSKRFIISAIFIGIVFLLFIILGSTLSGIITNSSISFDLLNITKIDGYSIIALLCFELLILSFILLTFWITEAIARIYSNIIQFSLLVVGMLVPFIIICVAFRICEGFVFLFIIPYFFYFQYLVKSDKVKSSIVTIIYFLILFSMFSTYVVFRTNNKIEKESRLTGAQRLANERDYVVEFMFNDVANSLNQDSTILKMIDRYPFSNDAELNEVIGYLKKVYFTGYWDKYEILITLCDSVKVLDIQPENYSINCKEYFDVQIQSYGLPTQFDNFTYLDYSNSPDNYLGIIELPQNKNDVFIYLEVFSRLIPRGLGYPELLMDQKAKSSFNITLYSWAKYKNNELVYHFGKYPYKMNLDEFIASPDENGFFNLNGFNHLYFPKDKDTILLISKKNPGLIDIAAPLSYFFIFYAVILLLLILIFKMPLQIQEYQLNFKKRLQISIISLVLISFIFTGLSSLYYIVSLNNNKNIDILKEKSHSVLIELEHKLSTEETLSSEIESFLSVLLYKLSLVFFSDINLYDLNGRLLATSRADIFNKGLISPMMNTLAFNQMNTFKSSIFIHQESIGDYSYLSAYLPLRNVENQTIAYLNLPYFAKQNELTNEIVTYLTAFINIYVILTAIAILITFIISNYISKPVQILKDKISRLKLGRHNEKIDWVQNDEIGSLVIEYNRMIDELAKSAEMLAKSERESAWREMAKQIAHEIKNPLTPMKLSVQYLQKSWDDKAPDWDQRLKRFTETLVEQIDSLSSIASEFSDFAKMPKSNFEVVELNKIIENAVRLFKDSHQVKFEFKSDQQHLTIADTEQLHRVFINLINNSIQAITDPGNGWIKISIEKDAGFHMIRFSDNGKGIPNEQKKKVFYPNFTTKSGGMGLGLAMVKNIIQNTNGEIKFESEEGKGTTFIIALPVYEE